MISVMTVQKIAQLVRARLDNVPLVEIQLTTSQMVFAPVHLTTILLTIRQVIVLNLYTVAKANTTMDGMVVKTALISVPRAISRLDTVTYVMKQRWKK
jgi:hypothetical protein